jgi:hypothetical protein
VLEHERNRVDDRRWGACRRSERRIQLVGRHHLVVDVDELARDHVVADLVELVELVRRHFVVDDVDVVQFCRGRRR